MENESKFEPGFFVVEKALWTEWLLSGGREKNAERGNDLKPDTEFGFGMEGSQFWRRSTYKSERSVSLHCFFSGDVSKGG